jgi:F420-0:gamma-glutamyl ligase-like protein
MKQKSETIEVFGQIYQRIPVKTHVLSADDDMLEIIKKYALPLMKEGDMLTISESPLAITQGRAIPVNQIRVSFLARLLSRFVAKVPYGIGLGAPTSMQCAIEETGVIRILFAAFVGAIGKLIGRKGDFYRVAGMQAALVDAATTSPIPPYNETVIKGPKEPQKVAEFLTDAIDYPVAIMDINDIGGSWMIGGSRLNKNFIEAVMKDNPQGQDDELTPLCIVRKAEA